MEILKLIAKIITIVSKGVDMLDAISKIVNKGGEEIIKFLDDDPM